MKARRGLFVVLEGPDKSGKSTQARRLAEHLRSEGLEVVLTREPGGTETGEQIRAIIVNNARGDELCAEAELLLFTAAVILVASVGKFGGALVGGKLGGLTLRESLALATGL